MKTTTSKYYPLYYSIRGIRPEQREWFYWLRNLIHVLFKKKRIWALAITAQPCGCFIKYKHVPSNSRKCLHGNYFVKYKDN